MLINKQNTWKKVHFIGRGQNHVGHTVSQLPWSRHKYFLRTPSGQSKRKKYKHLKSLIFLKFLEKKSFLEF